MKIFLDNLDHDDGMVLVFSFEKEAAKEDQSIEGTHWEAPADMNEAYALIMDRKGLVEDLRKQGYEVDDNDYCEPL